MDEIRVWRFSNLLNFVLQVINAIFRCNLSNNILQVIMSPSEKARAGRPEFIFVGQHPAMTSSSGYDTTKTGWCAGGAVFRSDLFSKPAS